MRGAMEILGAAAVLALIAPAAQAAPRARSEARTETRSLSERQTYQFRLDPGGRFEIKNISGDIRVERWDQPQASVEVEKVGQGSSDEEVREAMALWTLKVQDRPDEVRLEADFQPPGRRAERKGWGWWSDERDVSVAFHFVAKVPRGAALELASVNGEHLEIHGAGEGYVDAKNVNGAILYRGPGRDVELSTVNGAVTAELDSLEANASVQLKTVNGSVTLFLPGDAQADLHVKTLSGSLYSNLALPKRTIESFVGFEYEAKLGSGGGSVALETVNGAVRVLAPGSPPDAGEQLVEQRAPTIVIPRIEIPSIDLDHAEIDEAVREAQQAAAEAAREAREAAREGMREAREAAAEATRETREAALEAAREARETALEGARAARELAREARRAAHRGRHGRTGLELGGVVSGDLQIRESSESLRIGQIEGNAALVTYAGDIEVGQIGGDGKLLTYGGNVDVGEAARGLEAETYGGDVRVGVAHGPLIVKSKGGNIRVEKALAGATVETLGGDIQLDSVAGALRAETKGGDVEARLDPATPADAEVHIESKGGDLSLVLPKGRGASVRVEIVVPRREAGERHLETNLAGLERSVTDAGGDVRIVYTGVVNGGGPAVTLRTHAGEVSLREAR